MFSDYYY
ncbi:hypothetical protein CGLO_00247 [Colletotrichum gloeosporioides Cg-14]|nr:hypothetical protein CGLO_00247 [Colletotrichum gloeosporioides Cg-14]